MPNAAFHRLAVCHYVHMLTRSSLAAPNKSPWPVLLDRKPLENIYSNEAQESMIKVTSGAASLILPMLHRRQVVQQVVKALNRPALHAKTLGFSHPVTKEQLQFTSGLPADFEAALQRLRALQ